MAHFNYLIVLVSFAFIVSSGIFIFSRGFLLTRVARTEKRTCDKFYVNFNGKQCLSDDKKVCTEDYNSPADINFLFRSSEKICFERKSKIVIFVVDALKYEFGVYNETFKNPLPYQNKLPIIHELRKNHPDSTRLLKFFADPPTTTLQRLKGITTGSLPTFIDMGSNFATPEINEDNIIDQIKGNNKSVVFMGDGTWTELFPKRFKRTYSYPSFNIHDLDTIDNAILSHLPAEMAKNDWDVLIAHFLGIDHCGHKYGPMHPEMSRKLTEMNEIIKNYAATIDDDTVLLVIGDHGMTFTGDHGGASNDEIEALLFAYSKKPFVSTGYEENIDFIQQIDFTSTFATILGIPIPFSNLGTISLQLLPDVNFEGIKRHELLSMHLWQNLRQVQNYFETYAKDADIFEDMKSFENNFKELEKRFYTIESEEKFEEFAKDLRKELHKILEMCREAWINFNPQLMTQGMLISFVGIFTAFILTYNVPSKDFAAIYNNQVLFFQLAFSTLSGAVGFVFHKTFGWDESIVGALFMSALASSLVFGYLIITRWLIIVEEMMAAKKLTNLVPRLIFVLSIGVFFSNSFIVHEQKVLCYMLSIQVIYALYEIRKFTTLADFKNVKLKTAIIMKSFFMKILCVVIAIVVLLRISQNYFKCREEQGDCWDFTTNTEAIQSKDAMNLAPPVLLVLFVVIARIFLKTNGNLTGFSPHVIFLKFAPTLSVIAACGHLLIIQRQVKRQIIPYVHFDTLAWIVYGVMAIEIIMIIISPLLIYIMPRENERFTVSSYNTAITEIFKQIKGSFKEDTKAQIPIVYGLATVYSSVFVAFGKIMVIMFAILLGAFASNGLVVLMTIAVGCLFVFSVLRFESSSNLKECLQPRFSLIITWYLLYSYGFYCTSHQPTISQIDWNAAFVGRTASYDHSNFISALLVLANTFNANIVLLILYPLMVLFPFMLYAIYPQLCSSGTKNNKNCEYKRITLNTGYEDDEKASSVANVTRGEINLFEHEKLFMASVFKVGCQLIILQGTKAFASMIACTILCRHLMVWKIFAPRFIYEGIASYITFTAIILGFSLLIRVNKSVKILVDKVSKNC